MSTPAIALYTSDSVEGLIAAGGSAAWVMNLRNAAKHEYVVICNGGFNRGDVEHGAAVLVARIADIVPAPAANPKQRRWKVLFGPYARVNVPNAWDPKLQNPVNYTTLEKLGIDPEALSFDKTPPMPPAPPSAGGHFTYSGGIVVAPDASIQALTIGEAKVRLAATLGVAPEQIEITIRA